MDLSLRVKWPSKFSLLPPQSSPSTHYRCQGSQPHKSILCDRSEKLNTKLLLLNQPQSEQAKGLWRPLNVLSSQQEGATLKKKNISNTNDLMSKSQRKSPRITLQMWMGPNTAKALTWLEVISTNKCRKQLTRHKQNHKYYLEKSFWDLLQWQ